MDRPGGPEDAAGRPGRARLEDPRGAGRAPGAARARQAHRAVARCADVAAAVRRDRRHGQAGPARPPLVAAAGRTARPLRHHHRPGRLPDAGGHGSRRHQPARVGARAGRGVPLQRRGRGLRHRQRGRSGVRGPGDVLLPRSVPAGQPGQLRGRAGRARLRPHVRRAAVPAPVPTAGRLVRARLVRRRRGARQRAVRPGGPGDQPEAGADRGGAPAGLHPARPRTAARGQRAEPARDARRAGLPVRAVARCQHRQGQPLDPARPRGVARPQHPDRRARRHRRAADGPGRRGDRPGLGRRGAGSDADHGDSGLGHRRPRGRRRARRQHVRDGPRVRRRGLLDLLPAQGRGRRCAAGRRDGRPVRLPAGVEPDQLRSRRHRGLGAQAGSSGASRT